MSRSHVVKGRLYNSRKAATVDGVKNFLINFRTWFGIKFLISELIANTRGFPDVVGPVPQI